MKVQFRPCGHGLPIFPEGIWFDEFQMNLLQEPGGSLAASLDHVEWERRLHKRGTIVRPARESWAIGFRPTAAEALA
ncbi:MAG: hypothetical protein U0075_12005 [Thermomicrobiales bacterium]